MPNDCALALATAGVSSRVMKGVGTDLGAILDRKPIPGLVQRAGFFGKMIKFFRGDRFGFNSTDDALPTLDFKFPGCFPNPYTKGETTVEGRSGAGSASSEGLSKQSTSRPFIPVALTDTYSYVCDHMAKMETIKVYPQEISATEITQTVSPLGVKKGGSPALKRLQRSRHMKKAVLGNEYRAEEWRTVRHEAPQQTNGYDCGVFTITNGICLALGINAVDAYDKEELPLQRLRLAAMLLNRGFEGDFNLAGI
ncbi:hypothetical protein CTRI78_v011398 [Colletotrichum trifolii]|uniref:Ubiquitin-like protease family profile domain-containing protein n=1 Tax=Colletotrichum trifolii TaxID=5466 RepID=A0A4R8QE47_COLTR|nr:hypothetical protein CTRI78_v011398 [Colletotrichum trifolii]